MQRCPFCRGKMDGGREVSILVEVWFRFVRKGWVV